MRKMKDSGIAWIGEIPEGWEVKSIRHVIKSIFNGTTAQQIDEYDDNTVPVTRIETISTGEINTYKLGYVRKNEIDKKYKLHIGDILFSNINSLKMIGNCAIYKQDVGLYVGMNLLKISPNFNILPEYFYFVISSVTFKEVVKANAKPAINQASISQNSLIAIRWVFPPLPEQHRIAAYLDAKCAEIDRSMELVRQGMDKLKAYKMSVITEAVTKGLDPDVPMKDSGVPWIGEIPEGWETSSVRWEFDNLDGQRRPISAENRVITHGSYNYYGASGVIDKIDEYIFDEPLILIGEDGANLALRNLPLIYIATGKYWVNNHAHILKPKTKNALFYMAYQLECVDLFHFLTGSTQPKLTQANLSKIPVVCPSLPEQHRIAAYLDAKCAEIDAVIAKKQILLDKLAAYKKSLIFECVTGKREVAT